MRIGAAIHSVRAVAPEEMGVVAGWANERGLPLHAHVSEQPAENEACQAAYGRTPTELLAEAGALGERFTAIHVTHPTDRDRELLGEAGGDLLLLPDHRARTSPTASAPPRRCAPPGRASQSAATRRR